MLSVLSVFLYMNFARQNERDRDRERPEYTVGAVYLCIYFLYVIRGRRGTG